MVENQAYVFLWTIIIGTIMGLIFDLFRVIRRKGKTKDIVVYLQDIVFWMIVTVIIIVSTFLINDGELRGYMIFGYILGGIFYILLFSKLVRTVLSFILDFFDNLLKKICRLLNNIIHKRILFQKNNKKMEN